MLIATSPGSHPGLHRGLARGVSPRSSRWAAGVLGLLALLGVWGCGSDSGTNIIDPATLEFDASLGVDISQMTRTSSGLYYQDEVVGTGAEARQGYGVSVHYAGWFRNGVKFDDSRTDGFGALTVERLGGGEVIRGWDEGLVGMREGGTRLLVIPPHLAYGTQGVTIGGVAVIPANATLIFRVDLIEVIRP